MKKVLVVDDNNDISEMIKFTLVKRNIDVHINTTGINVVEDVVNYKPDLILMDIALPDKPGTQICKELKQNYAIPIILVSALNKDDSRLRECQAEGFIQKPFHLKELFETIRPHLVAAGNTSV